MEGNSGWTGELFTFKTKDIKEIRRAFGKGYPEEAQVAFINAVCVAMTKSMRDKNEVKFDHYGAIIRAKKLAKMLSEAAGSILRMTDTEKDIFDLVTSRESSARSDLTDTLTRAASVFTKVAEVQSMRRGEKVAGRKGASMFIAAAAASAWRRAFEREPSPDPDSRFSCAMVAILRAAKLPELGKAALLTVIGPAKRKPS